MENQELLAAIEAMLDKKLDEKLEPIQTQLDELREGQAELREGLEEVREGQADLREGLAEVRSGVNALLEWSEGVGEKFEMPLRPAQ